jgi:heme oxygenase
MSTLKELTSEKHKEAEEQPFIKSIFKGQVDRTKYIDYLYQLLVLYQSLEWHGTRLGIFKGIENIKRAKAIELDYYELIGDAESSGKVNASTINYMNYLETIKDDANKHPGVHLISAYLPSSFSDYIQLIGRVGREGKNGTALIFLF